MRRWVQFCGGPVILAVVGFLLMVLVEYVKYGTSLERFRLHVLYASQVTFLMGVAWTLRNLWMLLKELRARKT